MNLTENLRQLDKQYIWHPFTHMKQWMESDPLVITSGEGMYLIDSDGNRYLDGVSSLWCNVHGHRVAEIDNAIRAQLNKVAHTTMLGLASEPAILLAERLMKIVPPKLKKVFYSDAGATATEIAFKLAVQYWHNVGNSEKREFIALSGAYHGDTFGAMSVGRTEMFHQPFLPLLFRVRYIPTPFPYRSPISRALARWRAKQEGSSTLQFLTPEKVAQFSLSMLRLMLERCSNRIAAICLEPLVQGAAGMIVHPPGFLADVRKLADEFDVLLIADEVATGFGRTGKMFACEHENVQPDLMCVAKGITGGYLPLAATFAPQKIFDAFLGEPSEGKTFFHGHTYTGNPMACAAALASLDLFEKNDLLNHVHELARELESMLIEIARLKQVGDVRQKGLMVGIELVADKETRKPFDPKRRVGSQVCMNLRKHGVILRPLADTIVLMPPLAIQKDQLRKIIDALLIEIPLIAPD